MAPVSDIQYVEGPDGFVAYQVVGDGARDILYLGSWGFGFEMLWESPRMERFFRRLASVGRLILFDRRGCGLSDPLPRAFLSPDDFSLAIEEAVADLLLVLDAVRSESTAIVASYAGTMPAMQFAAVRPERVSSLVLIDPNPKFLRSDDYPGGITPAMRDLAVEALDARWGCGSLAAVLPGIAGDAEAMSWLARAERYGCPRGVMKRYWQHLDFDLRALLPSIQCPTLVMYHDGQPMAPAGAADFVVQTIPNAVGPELIDGVDIEMFGKQPPELNERIVGFLAAAGGDDEPSDEDEDRTFAVVLFTDLVQSTEGVVSSGDRRWGELLAVQDSVVRRQLERHRGQWVKDTGDGVLATFDAPARAVRCADRILAELRMAGLEARAGIHAGEITRRGADILGVAVHIAARVMADALPGEVVVSRTVRDLVVGSGLAFDARGARQLKGIPEEWELFTLERKATP